MSTMTRVDIPSLSGMHSHRLGVTAIVGERPSVGQRMLARAVAHTESSRYSPLNQDLVLVVLVLLAMLTIVTIVR